MEIAALTAFLAPILGHLLKGTSEAAGEAAERFGAKGWDYAVQLWRRLADNVEQRPAAKEAAQDVAAQPDNSTAQGALTWQLEKILTEDASLRAEITTLWQQAQSSGATVNVSAGGERSVAIAGGVHDSNVSTGDTDAAPRPKPGNPRA